DTFDHFMGFVVFSSEFAPEGFTVDAAGEMERRAVEAFILAAPSNMAPIVGQQATLTTSDAAVAGPRVDLLEARADVGECDLIAKLAGPSCGDRGFFYAGSGAFYGDRAADPPLADAALRALVSAADCSMTFTCAPPGSGVRMGIDRD